MTRFTDEQHKNLMLGCMKMLEGMKEMFKHTDNDEELNEELHAIAKCLMNFSGKMIGK